MSFCSVVFRSFVVVVLFLIHNTLCDRWDVVDQVLLNGISKHVYPGCVAAVGNSRGFLYLKAFGNFTYGIPPPETPGINPPMTFDTRFDMASLTKVLVTTTAIMQFYQRGELNLETQVADPKLLGNAFNNNGKGPITVKNLLLHNAGFPPDPSPEYWSLEFGCPETFKYHPDETFTCQEKIYHALMLQKLSYPVGTKMIYSDLSMITAMYVIGKLAQQLGYVHPEELLPACAAPLQPNNPAIAQCYYEAYVRKFVIAPLNLQSTGFLPPKSVWKEAAPTWNDTSYRHLIIQGTVSDGNAYALGGISGHAGLFSTIRDTARIAHKLMYCTPEDPYVNRTTVDFFTRVYNLTQSSRALGWDTNNYLMDSYRGCGNLSSNAFYHTGYTGTEVCCDPNRKIFTILLTNRCYPDSTSTLPAIQIVRQQFNNAVKSVLDSHSIEILEQKIIPFEI